LISFAANGKIMFNRRTFLAGAACGATCQALLPGSLQDTRATSGHRLPETDSHARRVQSYIESTPIPEYQWASSAAYEAFRDMKVGVRIHWGIYSLAGLLHESWPFLQMDFAQRARYNELYKSWN